MKVGTVWAHAVTQVRRPRKSLGYEPVFNGSKLWLDVSADEVCTTHATHVVTHWSDGTCTIDTIDAFREAHK